MRSPTRYDAIIFDLFSTVAIWQVDRLPVFEWRGRTQRSTLSLLRPSLESLLVDTTFDNFVDQLMMVNDELQTRRVREMREIPSHERFLRTLTYCGYPNTDETHVLAETLSCKHMALLASAVEIPPAHINFLDRLGDEYRLALISNFDHGETARDILRRDGAEEFFNPIVISDEHGWRKPHHKIFTDTLDTLELTPTQALYVGDSIDDDVIGAKSAGLSVAWINAHDSALWNDCPAPDLIVRAIPDLAADLLGGC